MLVRIIDAFERYGVKFRKDLTLNVSRQDYEFHFMRGQMLPVTPEAIEEVREMAREQYPDVIDATLPIDQVAALFQIKEC